MDVQGGISFFHFLFLCSLFVMYLQCGTSIALNRPPIKPLNSCCPGGVEGQFTTLWFTEAMTHLGCVLANFQTGGNQYMKGQSKTLFPVSLRRYTALSEYTKLSDRDFNMSAVISSVYLKPSQILLFCLLVLAEFVFTANSQLCAYVCGE